MSNGKSRRLSRKAGTHTIYGPSSGNSITVEELNERIQLIWKIVERLDSDAVRKSDEVIKAFARVIKATKTCPDEIAHIAAKTDENVTTIRALLGLYMSLPEPEDVEFALSLLFMNRRW